MPRFVSKMVIDSEKKMTLKINRRKRRCNQISRNQERGRDTRTPAKPCPSLQTSSDVTIFVGGELADGS